MAASQDPLLLSNGGSERRKPLSRLTRSFARWVLKAFMWVIFLGWVFIFFFVPSGTGTDFYDDWVDATEGTLFGSTGSALVLYSAPIALIAVLAVPYLLLSETEEEQLTERGEKQKPKFSLGTFPVLVGWPFGVVTVAEFIGIVLFVVFVLWSVYAYTVVNLAILPSYGSLTPGEKRVQMLQMSAYCFGLVASSCLSFLFLPVARGSILLRLIDVPFEHATKYHIWLGNLIIFLVTVHGLCYMIVWFIRGIVLKSIIEWKSDGGANCAGVITYAFGFLIWLTALPPVRRKNFQLFFYTHHLYILFIIFLALHIGDANFSKFCGGIFLFMLDRFLRFFQSRKDVEVISATNFPCGTVGLVICKPKFLHYNALGFVFLRVREISKLQWHPFSVSSSPLDGKYHISVLIKAVGDWTWRLRQNVSNLSSQETQIFEPPTKFMVNVEGPYGHESPYHLMYRNLILVAGGSGISPFIAILSDILHRVKDSKPCLPRDVILVWAVKRSSEIPLLSTIGVKALNPSSLDGLNVNIQVYVTQELEPPLVGSIVISSKCESYPIFSYKSMFVCHLQEEGEFEKFKSLSVSNRSRGQGMSILVGTGDKGWSGTYVIVPILGFILLLGLLDVCYLNPYDISYWWYRGLLLLICMVVSVVLFGGFVIALWHAWENKCLSSEEDPAEDSVEARSMLQERTTPERDLYSDFTSINYGRRPDFKEIFGTASDSWGNVDIGVIVCGPQTLQSSVAKECRSQGLRRRRDGPVFHFNSHSFNL
ncbi:hypothetical protein SAY86_008571 [Trapa natans]|uniref:FAD-binding FR-type domain-containing protein n=1 Tax=Trapa natans TaxID=22666 RepID=A0AAN7KE51_TRANT|nr:hypothetical protein SAY86_008571 [Trapa natans]